MVDQILLNDTLQKINASLNKRFEKDAELYISRQDEYEIKKHFCNEAYGAVVDMAKARGISHDIVVKVLLRNAGVINVTDTGRFKRELQPIFQDADYRALSYMMEDVLSNNVYMQKKVRHVIFSYYMSGITAEDRLQYWRQESFAFDSNERKELYGLILSEKRGDRGSSMESKIDFMKDAFVRYPSILKDRNAMLKLAASLEEGERSNFFSQYLCKEMGEPSIKSDAYDFVLANTYASYGEMAFNDIVNQIRSGSPYRFKQYIKVLCKLLWMEKDKDTLVRMFDTIHRVYDSGYIKNHIRREVSRKVWKTARENKVLYQERKVQIDALMSEVEETDKNKYTSHADILAELTKGVKPKSVAFFWVNMKSPAFEESLEASFDEEDSEYISIIGEVYNWIFAHSMQKGGPQELNRLCERIAASLHRFVEAEKWSQNYGCMDKYWLDYVTKYKFKGKNIENYMFAFHYDKVKEWKR